MLGRGSAGVGLGVGGGVGAGLGGGVGRGVGAGVGAGLGAGVGAGVGSRRWDRCWGGCGSRNNSYDHIITIRSLANLHRQFHEQSRCCQRSSPGLAKDSFGECASVLAARAWLDDHAN